MGTKGSFYAEAQTTYTESSPPAPADTVVTPNTGDAKSSFFNGGQVYASVETVQSTYDDMIAARDAAAASATAAAASKTDAAASDADAVAHASAASTSETNAASSASAALASENAAATSETNAAASATAASTSETNAASSAASALASKNAAATSETNAASSETAAASSASAASASASSAASAADTEIAAKAVRFDAAQSLTGPQQAQAKTNIALNNVTNDAQTKASVLPNTAPTNGQIPLGQTSLNGYIPATIIGDATLDNAGTLTVTKTNGTAFGTAATKDVGTGANNVVQLDGTGKLPAVDGSQLTGLSSSGLTGFRNKLINGGFRVNQRSVSGTVTLAAGVYGHDRWKAGASGCTYTFSTTDNVTTLTISAGSLQQVIEGNNLIDGTHTLSWSGTAQGKINSGSYSASGVTGTATGGTNLTVEFNTGTLSNVQFEKASAATTFEQRPYGLELFLSQRYYCNSFPPGTAPADNVAADDYFLCAYGGAAAGTQFIAFPTIMRAIPTMTFYSASGRVASPSAGQWQYYNAGWGNGSSTALLNVGLTGFAVNMAGSFSTGAAYICAGEWAASAEL